MKKIILTAGIIIMSQLLFAQDMDKASQRANERYEKYNNVLGFSTEQSEKIQSLLEGIEQKQEYVRTDTNLSNDQKAEYTAKNEEAFKAIFIGYLTDLQKEKYNELFSEE